MSGDLLSALGAAQLPPELPSGDAHVLALLGGHQIAVPFTALVAVADLGEITPLPLAPAWLLGVSNLRGAVLPVISLAAMLGWEMRRPGTRALVLRDGEFTLAAPVDAVQGVRWLNEPGLPTPDGLLAHELTIDERPTWVVNAEALLAQVRHGDQAAIAGR